MSFARTASSIVSKVVSELVAERKRQAISMNRLAQLTGLSLTSISYVERGMRSPTFETIVRIALALNADLPELTKRAVEAGTLKTGRSAK